jgi:hypothetical protein
VAKTSSPARRTRRERRAGAAIAAEKRGSESSSDLTAADTVCGWGESPRSLGFGTWKLCWAVPERAHVMARPTRGRGISPGEISTSASISDQLCVIRCLDSNISFHFKKF